MFLAVYTFRPFLNSPPIWDYWLLLIVPLVVGVAVVYKTMKVATFAELPVQAILTCVYILAAMAGIAAAVSIVNALV